MDNSTAVVFSPGDSNRHHQSRQGPRHIDYAVIALETRYGVLKLDHFNVTCFDRKRRCAMVWCDELGIWKTPKKHKISAWFDALPNLTLRDLFSHSPRRAGPAASERSDLGRVPAGANQPGINATPEVDDTSPTFGHVPADANQPGIYVRLALVAMPSK